MEELLTYWRVIKRRFWLIGLLVTTTLGVMMLIAYLSGYRYTTAASFEVSAPLPAGVSLFREYRTSSTADEVDRTRTLFLTTLQSGYVVGQVIDELGLDMEPSELLEQIVIEPDEQGAFTLVRVTAHDPKLTADIANTLLDKALSYFGEVGASALTANRKFIRQQLEETKAELDAAREAYIQFRIENRLSDLDDALNRQENLISDLVLWRDQAIAKGDEEAVRRYDLQITERERELQGLILLISEDTVLRESIARIDGIYATLVSADTEAALKENEVLSATYVQVIPAREPKRPLPLVAPKILLLGGIVSLALGVMLAFVLQAAEPASVSSAQESAGAVQEFPAEPGKLGDAELKSAPSEAL